MKVYINNILVKSEIVPSNTPTLDETLETFSFALISNKDALPYAPMQQVKVDFLGDGSEIVIFYLVSDSVETYSLNPLRYKHTLSCIQNTRELSKHLVRNSVFSQPANPVKESFNSHYFGYDNIDKRYEQLALFMIPTVTTTNLNSASKPFEIEKNEKIRNLRLRIDFMVCLGNTTSGSGGYQKWVTKDTNIPADGFDVNTDIYVPQGETRTKFNRIKVKWWDIEATENEFYLTPQDLGLTEFEFNKDFECPIFDYIIEDGAVKIELLLEDAPFQITNMNLSNYSSDNTTLGYIINLKIVADVYYYSCYDILELLLKRQRHDTSLGQDNDLFVLPQAGDDDQETELYNLLTNTVAPNFTFTQLTMYECVAEVFRLFDSIFTMDENGKLGIEYFNDLSKEEITPRLVGRNTSISEDKYTNGLVSYYQDGRPLKAFPYGKHYAHLRTDEYGPITTTSDKHCFIVDSPIYMIKKVYVDTNLYCYFKTSGGLKKIEVGYREGVDVSYRVVEQTVWQQLDTKVVDNDDDVDNWNLYQETCLYYAQGSKEIRLSHKITSQDIYTHHWYAISRALKSQVALIYGLKYQRTDDVESEFNGATPDWSNIRMRVEYIATIDGKVQVESLRYKYEGETYVDQYNGAVDLNKMGINMLGLSLKLGNPTLNATHRITKWADRIKTGQIYYYDSAPWVANVVSYTFFNGYIQGKVSFVQNFNALSLRTRLLREKRMTNISQDLVVKSEDIFIEYLYFTSDSDDLYNNDNEPLEADTLHFKTNNIRNFLQDSFRTSEREYNYVAVFKNNGGGAYEGGFGEALPLSIYGLGNSICFEMYYFNSISAGPQTDNGTEDYSSWTYYTKPFLYANQNGFLDSCDIGIENATDRTHFTTEPRTYPKKGFSYDTSIYDILIQEYMVFKQPNEIFALNYQVCFLPLPNKESVDFIGQYFINHNVLTELRKYERSNQCYLALLPNKSSVLDTTIRGITLSGKKAISSVNGNIGNQNEVIITCNLDSQITVQESEGCVSWAIVDSDDNILFASNQKTTVVAPRRDSFNLYFFPKLKRLKNNYKENE